MLDTPDNEQSLNARLLSSNRQLEQESDRLARENEHLSMQLAKTRAQLNRSRKVCEFVRSMPGIPVEIQKEARLLSE